MVNHPGAVDDHVEVETQYGGFCKIPEYDTADGNSEKFWRFPQMGVPKMDSLSWFIMEHTMKMDDLGYPYFRKPACGAGEPTLVT